MKRMSSSEKQPLSTQGDEAIAVFDSSHRLILFNQKFTQLWNLSPEWLKQNPKGNEIFAHNVSQNYWSETEQNQMLSALESDDGDRTEAGGGANRSFSLYQKNDTPLEVSTITTSEGGKLFNFRDLSDREQSQDNLNQEVRRLTFLLGLTERLQPARDLQEIGEFALSYLVQTMGAAFGDVKVISGEGKNRQANLLTNEISAEFVATYGDAVKEMESLLKKGIPYGQGLLWEVVNTGKPLFVDDYQNHPGAVSEFRHPGIGKLGIFPIPGAVGDIIGVVTLESRGEGIQDAPHQDMLLAACRTLGVAIERAQDRERFREVNENLERASQLKSEFLASMSHELRTPLNSILGFSDLLRRQTGGTLTPRQVTHVQAIEKSGEHLLQLINDILDLSKIEAGKAELELTPVSIHSLCSQCLKIIQPGADKKRLSLYLELDYRLQEASLDERRVRQMLINLLSNSIKFTPEEGQIKLRGRIAYGSHLQQEFRPDRSPINATTPYLCFEVQDTGIGIPQNKQHLLFRPFQQVDCSLSRRHEGTGLGLALTKRLAELHGGTVSVESEEDRGSTFKVWLPLTEMREDLAAEELGSPLLPVLSSREQAFSFKLGDPLGGWALPNRRVLVVEDQLYNQVLISEVLELEGYQSEIIFDGRTMLDMIYSRWIRKPMLPSLILMDIQLPGVDGFEVIRQLKAHPIWMAVPTIAVTALAMTGDRDRCLEAGADDYISKPLDITRLIELIRFWTKNS